MQLILHGKFITPLITKRTTFKIKGCNTKFSQPRRRIYSKIHSTKPMFPYALICYLGEFELSYSYSSKNRANKKIHELLRIKSIGRYSSEGLGKIQWIKGELHPSSTRSENKKQRNSRRIRIRKGLPHNLPTKIQQLIRYALLHDFVHTPRHKSKIYIEPLFDDGEFITLLRQHHDNSNNVLIQTFQKYDRIAASITRKIRSPRTTRYNWYSTQNIDFTELCRNIKEVVPNIWKLYKYIYESKALTCISEALEYGHTSLRDHLLIIANLIVQDFQQNRIEVNLCSE